MKREDVTVLAVRTILLSVFGLCALPFCCVIVQYIDSMTGFSTGSGYFSNPMSYLTRSPLIYLLIILCVDLILAAGCLIWNRHRRSE